MSCVVLMAYNCLRSVGGYGISGGDCNTWMLVMLCVTDVCKQWLVVLQCSIHRSNFMSSSLHVSPLLHAAPGGATVSPAGLQTCGSGAGPREGAVHTDRDCGQAANAR